MGMLGPVPAPKLNLTHPLSCPDNSWIVSHSLRRWSPNHIYNCKSKAFPLFFPRCSKAPLPTMTLDLCCERKCEQTIFVYYDMSAPSPNSSLWASGRTGGTRGRVVDVVSTAWKLLWNLPSLGHKHHDISDLKYNYGKPIFLRSNFSLKDLLSDPNLVKTALINAFGYLRL